MSTRKSLVNAAYTEEIKKAKNRKRKSDTEKAMENMGILPGSPEAAVIEKEAAEIEAAREQGKAAAKGRAAAAGKRAKAPTGYKPTTTAAKPAPEQEQQPEPQQPTPEPQQQQPTAEERARAEQEQKAAKAARAERAAAEARAAEERAAKNTAIAKLNAIDIIDQFVDYKTIRDLKQYPIPEKSRSTPKNKRVQLLIHDDIFECVQAAATISGRSVNEIFTAAVYKLCRDYSAALKTKSEPDKYPE